MNLEYLSNFQFISSFLASVFLLFFHFTRSFKFLFFLCLFEITLFYFDMLNNMKISLTRHVESTHVVEFIVRQKIFQGLSFIELDVAKTERRFCGSFRGSIQKIKLALEDVPRIAEGLSTSCFSCSVLQSPCLHLCTVGDVVGKPLRGLSRITL